MELIVFDLDGTLLNGQSVISDYTRDTLRRLSDKDIAYTVATGRTLHASRDVLLDQGFLLPQAYKNGVVIWHPDQRHFTHRNILTTDELAAVTAACLSQGLAPLVFTLEGNEELSVYHPPLRTPAEKHVVTEYSIRRGLKAHPLTEIPDGAEISNISAIGEKALVSAVIDFVEDEAHLIAYSGVALEAEDLYWLDIHHSDASKGSAIGTLKELTGASRVICFGDSDNDASMFKAADECYAPANAKASIQALATEIIGHHDEDGIARFLRQRYSLDY
ncbi:MAG: HAD-IIB family hydrolase [Woeseiaceae bacterium]